MPLRALALIGFFAASLPVCFFRPFYGIVLWIVVAFLNPQSFTWGAAYIFPFALAVAVPTLLGMLLFDRRFERLLSFKSGLLFILWIWFSITTLVSTNSPEFAHHAAETIGTLAVRLEDHADDGLHDCDRAFLRAVALSGIDHRRMLRALCSEVFSLAHRYWRNPSSVRAGKFHDRGQHGLRARTDDDAADVLFPGTSRTQSMDETNAGRPVRHDDSGDFFHLLARRPGRRGGGGSYSCCCSRGGG